MTSNNFNDSISAKLARIFTGLIDISNLIVWVLVSNWGRLQYLDVYLIFEHNLLRRLNYEIDVEESLLSLM